MTERLPLSDPAGRVQILQVPDCPLVDDLRELVAACQAELGDSPAMQLLVGSYPSPTLLIDGLDVTTGQPVTGAARCRLDLPTKEQIHNALAKKG